MELHTPLSQSNERFSSTKIAYRGKYEKESNPAGEKPDLPYFTSAYLADKSSTFFMTITAIIRNNAICDSAHGGSSTAIDRDITFSGEAIYLPAVADDVK